MCKREFICVKSTRMFQYKQRENLINKVNNNITYISEIYRETLHNCYYLMYDNITKDVSLFIWNVVIKSWKLNLYIVMHSHA